MDDLDKVQPQSVRHFHEQQRIIPPSIFNSFPMDPEIWKMEKGSLTMFFEVSNRVF